MTGEAPGAVNPGVTLDFPLVGRARECERLRDAVARVAAGQAQTVLVEGEAGIGKTRLVEELQEYALREGFRLIAGKAEELESLRPFGAIADALATLERSDDDPAAPLRAILRERSDRSTAEPRMIDALLDFMEELAIGGPVALVVEDLHWADATTIAAIRTVARRLSYLPILVVGTHRPHPSSSELLRLIDVSSRESGVSIALHPLTDTEVAELASEMLGAAPGPGLARIIEGASGNPLFVTEIIRGLGEQNAIQAANGIADTEVDSLPPTLRLTILRRLSFLPADTLDVLRHAAVLGWSFRIEELAAMIGRLAREVVRTLKPALASRVLGERGESLSFRHDLLRTAIYDDIAGPIRASMHLEAADALRSLSVSPLREAQHLLRGAEALTPDSVKRLTDAAKALRFKAPRISIDLNGRAISMLGEGDARTNELRLQTLIPLAAVGRTAEALALAEMMLARHPDPVLEARIRLSRIETRQREGRSAECIPELREMADDPRYPEQIRRVVRAALAGAYIRSDHAREALELGQRVVAEARAAGDHRALVGGLTSVAGAMLMQGRVTEGLPHLMEVVALDTEERTSLVTPHMQLSWALIEADRVEDARSLILAGRRREEGAGEIASLAAFAHMSALLAFVRGDWEDAIAEAKTGLGLVAEGIGSSNGIVASYASLAQIYLRRGDVDGCASVVSQARRLFAEKGPMVMVRLIDWCDALHREATGDVPGAVDVGWRAWEELGEFRYGPARYMAGDFVRIILASGDLKRAEAVADDAQECARRARGIPSAEGIALLCRGLVDDNPDLLVAAVGAYRRSPRILDKALACEDAAVSLTRHGRTVEARSHFDEALAVYEELRAVREMARLTSAMRAAGIHRGSKAPRRRASSGLEALTPSEFEVARLAVEGLTNPQIAERLFVSKYTVMTHLRHVFEKMGLSSRVELTAAWSRGQQKPSAPR